MSSELPTQDEIISDDDVPVPDWHLAIVEERMARYESQPVEWTPLEEFEKELNQSSAEIVNDDDVPVPDWHLAILEERIARDGVHFPNGTPWEELRNELMQEIVEEIKRRKN